jgi:hypothetical protein
MAQASIKLTKFLRQMPRKKVHVMMLRQYW